MAESVMPSAKARTRMTSARFCNPHYASAIRHPNPAMLEHSLDLETQRDEADVARASAGDVEAFDALMARHETKVFNLCLWVLGDRDEAADATQDAFIRAYRHLKKFRGDCAFGSWVSRIAINVARDALKKKRVRPRDFSSMEWQDGPEFDPPDTARAAPDEVARHERQMAVRCALAKVPENYRTTLILFDLQGRSYEECADVLQVPIGTIKSRLSRARAALRDALGADRELFDV